VAICVAALTLSSQFIFSEFNFQIVCFAFFSTFLSYNFHSFFSRNRIEGFRLTTIFNHFSNPMILLLLISFILGFLLFIKFEKITQFIIIILSLIAFFYPFFLRELPFLKIFLIATSWTTTSVVILLFENNVIIDQSVMLAFVKRFLFVLAITIPFDLRDYRFDSVKMKTFPHVFGYNASKKIAIGFLIVYLGISIFEFLQLDLKLSFLVSFVLTFVYSSYLILITSEKKNKLFFSLFVESASISILFFLIITSIFL
jgi:4-hydroxybenzoate polyprenyltransferase